MTPTTPPQIRARRSLGAMVAASIVSAVCGVAQTFWIPRVLSVNDYGYWRMFLLYISYAGLLHLGLVDGALLLWSRHTQHLGPDRKVFVKTLQFVVVEQLLVIAVAVLWLTFSSSRTAAAVLIALAIYILLFNLLCTAQVYLQTHGQFSQVALGNSLPGTIFIALLVALAFTGHATVHGLLSAYLVSWAITVTVLLAQALRVRPPLDTATPPPAPGGSSWGLGFAYIAAGWPIVLSNTGFALMQSADRVTVNLTRPLRDFAVYSLSQSTVSVPILILAAISRVAFSYFARTTHEDRGKVYRGSSSAITLLWTLLLPYYFAVEFVVHRFLPKYAASLPADRILLISVLFLSLIQIVQLNSFSLDGRQRQFFAGSVVAVAVAFATAWVGSRVVGTLAAVAWSQVVTAALWWLGNEYFLRKRSGVRPWDILRILFCFSFATAALFGVRALTPSLVLDAVLYTALALPACALLFPEQRQILTQRIAELSLRRAPGTSSL